jgi:hypothetical protein
LAWDSAGCQSGFDRRPIAEQLGEHFPFLCLFPGAKPPIIRSHPPTQSGVIDRFCRDIGAVQFPARGRTGVKQIPETSLVILIVVRADDGIQIDRASLIVLLELPINEITDVLACGLLGSRPPAVNQYAAVIRCAN